MDRAQFRPVPVGPIQGRDSKIHTTSILGSGWLGLPLAANLVSKHYCVKASTTSDSRLAEIAAIEAVPFLIDIERLTSTIQTFLQAEVLVVNIPSKHVTAFAALIKEIERSSIEKVLFVSSTSVYENCNRVVAESDGLESPENELSRIENLFRSNAHFESTIIRFGGLIGYRRNPGRFFEIHKCIEDPDARVNLIHRDDCIRIIDRILENNAWDETFNCCADSHPTKREFYTYAARSAGCNVPSFGKSSTQRFKIVSNEKVKRVLAYEFKYADLMKIDFSENDLNS